MRKYKDWEIDKTVESPLCEYEFCTNGKSVLYGQERALVIVIRKKTPRIEYKKTDYDRNI